MHTRILATCVLLSLATASASAQEARIITLGAGAAHAELHLAHVLQTRATGYVGTDLMMLMGNPQIRKELDLLDEQQQELRDLQKEVGQMWRDFHEENVKDPRKADWKKIAEAQQKARKNIQQMAQERLKEILLPRQFERMEEIRHQSSLRYQGVSALSRGKLAEALGITDKQKRKLAEKNSKIHQEIARRMEEIKRQLQQEALEEVLTEEQLAQLKSLTGDQFEFHRPRTKFFQSTVRSKGEESKSKSNEK